MYTPACVAGAYTIVFFPETLALRFSPIVFQRWPEMAPVGTNPAQFLDWGAESRLVTSFASPGPGWPGIGVMTEDYDKIGTALERRELARELVPISTKESTSGLRTLRSKCCVAFLRFESGGFYCLCFDYFSFSLTLRGGSMSCRKSLTPWGLRHRGAKTNIR